MPINQKLLLTALLAIAPHTFAQAQPMDVQAELRELKAQVAELRAQSSDTWMTQRRAQEVKALIGDVLADADTRASMAGSAMTAGYHDHFFLASEDGNFLMILQGELQTRYIYNNLDDDDTSTDNNIAGFQQKRTRLQFKGHLYDPRLQYQIRGGFASNGDAFQLEVGFAKYNFTENFYARIGQFKGRFLREEQISPFKQMAIERSNVNEFFTLDYTQGVEMGGQYDAFNWSALLYGGRETDATNWNNDGTEFAVAARAELLLAGSMSQFQGEFLGWSGSDFGLMLGAAIDYEKMEVGTDPNNPDSFYQWTADINMQMDPINVFAAIVGRDIDPTTGSNPSQLGIVAQANMFIVPDKWDIFLRYENIQHDGVGEVVLGSSPAYAPATIDPDRQDNLDIWTVGANYYIRKNKSKATLDFMWAPDGIIRGETGTGTVGRAGANNNQTQYVVRAQYQLTF